MKKIVTTITFLLIATIVFGQESNERILYIVDSIPIIEEPAEGFSILSQEEIDKIEVVKNKVEIEKTGFKNFDGIIYVFTKEYAQRPDSIKAIPTTKTMIKKAGTWYLKNDSNPYNGRFIDYYLNGKKQGEGILFNGRLRGERLIYHLNGVVSDIVEYEDGTTNGLEQRFYDTGILMQQGKLQNGKEFGIWEMYHPNGKLKQSSFFENGKMLGESISYYSTGEIKGKSNYKNGIYVNEKSSDKVYKLYNEAQELFNQGNYKSAIKKLDKVLELNPNWADGYFARGTMKLNNFQFEESKTDFDKTLTIEPLFVNAYANRAFTAIRKYEFADSRKLSDSKQMKVIATMEKEIPKTELKNICADLTKAVELGDTNEMVLQALEKYCKN